jgi:hypothetical protein
MNRKRREESMEGVNFDPMLVSHIAIRYSKSELFYMMLVAYGFFFVLKDQVYILNM